MKILLNAIISFWILFASSLALADLKSQVSDYDKAYRLRTLHQKLVDYSGRYLGPKGHDLSELKNVKMALPGILYWGGANNTGRDNRNPLRAGALLSLCQEGFTTAIYLYDTGWDKAVKETSCTTRAGKSNTIRYLSKNPLADQKMILEQIYNRIKQISAGPLYLHCWNGLHASNQIAAIVLKQFCDYSADEALSFWHINAEGTEQTGHFAPFLQEIREFKVDPEFEITSAEKELVCLRHN